MSVADGGQQEEDKGSVEDLFADDMIPPDVTEPCHAELVASHTNAASSSYAALPMRTLAPPSSTEDDDWVHIENVAPIAPATTSALPPCLSDADEDDFARAIAEACEHSARDSAHLGSG